MNILERIIGQINRFVAFLPDRLPLPEIILATFAGLIFFAFLWALVRGAGGEVGKFKKSAKRIVACGENFQEAKEELNNLPARPHRLYLRSVEFNAPVSAVMTKDACVTQPYAISGAARMGAFVRNSAIILTSLCVLIMAITCEDGCILAPFVLLAAGILLIFGLLLSVFAGAVGRGQQRKGCKAYDNLIDYLEGEYTQFSLDNNISDRAFEPASRPVVYSSASMSAAQAVPVYREPQAGDVEDVNDMLEALKREGAEKAEREREAEVEIQRLVAEKAKAEKKAAEEAAEKAAAKAAKEKAAKEAALEKERIAKELALEKAAEKAAKKADADKLALEKAAEKTAKERAAREIAEERAVEAEKAAKKASKTPVSKKPAGDNTAKKSPYRTTKSPNAAVPEDIIKRIDQMDENTPLATMQEVAVLLQEERSKPENKTPEQQRKLNEALAALLKAMDKK